MEAGEGATTAICQLEQEKVRGGEEGLCSTELRAAFNFSPLPPPQRVLQEKLEAAYLTAQEKSREFEEKREAASAKNSQVSLAGIMEG